MAINKDVNIIISAKDQYSNMMKEFTGSWGGAIKNIELASLAIAGVSIAMAKIGSDAMTSFVDAAVDFHDGVMAVAAIAKPLGTTESEISGILDTMVEKFPITGKIGAEALQKIAQKGFGTAEQLALVSDAAMTLSLATGTDLDTAVGVLTNTMNTLKVPLSEVNTIVDTFASGSFKSGMSVNDFAEAIKYAGSEAALTGIPMEEMVYTLGALRDKGLEASQAGTTFRMGMTMLYKPTKQGASALKELGLTYDDVNPSVHSLSEVIGKLAGQTMTAEQATAIFGVTAKTMSGVFNDGVDKFKAGVSAISDTSDGYDACAINLGKWVNVMDNLGGSFDAFKKKIGDDLLPVIIELVGKGQYDGIRGVVSSLGDLEKAQGKLGKPMEDLINDFKALAEKTFENTVGSVEGLYEWLARISGFFTKNMEILGIWAANFFEVFFNATNDTSNLNLALHIINAALTSLALPVAMLHDVFGGFFYALNLGWDLAEKAVMGFALITTTILDKIYKAIDALPFTDLGNRIEQNQKQIDKWKYMYEGAFDTKPLELWTKKVGEVHTDVTSAILDMTDNVKVGVEEVSKETTKQVDLTGDEILALGEDFEVVDGKAVAVEKSIEKEGKAVKDVKDEVKDLSKELEKTHKLDLETKQFEHDLSMAVKKLDNAHEIAQTKLQLKADVDITAMETSLGIIEARADMFKGAMEAFGESISGIGDQISSMIGAFISDDIGTVDKWNIEDWIDDSLKMQRDLTDSQIELNKELMQTEDARQEAMKKEIKVEVQTDGADWLKGLLEDLMEEVIIKAKAEGFEAFGYE